MIETESYSIKQTTSPKVAKLPDDAMCICGHSLAAHGSNGMICAACVCRNFVEKHNPTKAKQGGSIA